MRMWKVDPTKLCTKHLGGEHLEMHMFVGCINKGISVDGYIENGLVEIHNIENRHTELAFELLKRQAIRSKDKTQNEFFHKSTLPKFKCWRAGKVDIDDNIEELKRRCSKCRENFI